MAIGTVKGKHVLKRKVLRTTGQKYKQWVLTPEAKRAKRAKAKARLAASLKDKRKPSAKRARGGGGDNRFSGVSCARRPPLKHRPRE